MKKNFFFLKGVLALALVFTLFFAGCEEESEDAPVVIPPSKDVYLPGISNLNVTERVISTGVIFTWTPVIEAASYQVWRNGGGQTGPRRLTTITQPDDKETVSYTDTRTATNELKLNSTYIYTVLAIPSSSVKDISRWDKAITIHDPLFGDTASFSVPDITIDSDWLLNTSDDTITGFIATIPDLSSLSQSGVTYTVERAILDANGNPSAYQPVTLSKVRTTEEPIGEMLTADIFGNLPLQQVCYDRGLPPVEGKYQYRIKGVKGNAVEYVKAVNIITINFKDYFSTKVALSVETKTNANSNDTYKITPNYTAKKGMLQSTDKVVLYWLIGDIEDCYKYGPYKTINSIAFLKNELESQTAMNLVVPQKTTGKYLYVQAYLERANGDKQLINTWTGSGRFSSTTYNGQFHVRLEY